MVLALPFPMIDPVLVEIGPFAIRWYALAYICGLMIGWRYVRHLSALPPTIMSREQVDDLLVWVTLGVILGGRLGYVLFYQPGYYLGHPLEALAVWHGGMSFHGGLLGVLFAGWLFSRRNGLHPLRVGDAVACAAPIGIFLGRLANFAGGRAMGIRLPERSPAGAAPPEPALRGRAGGYRAVRPALYPLPQPRDP